MELGQRLVELAELVVHQAPVQEQIGRERPQFGGLLKFLEGLAVTPLLVVGEGQLEMRAPLVGRLAHRVFPKR